MDAARDRQGRFVSNEDELTLMRVVREVSLAAAPTAGGSPTAVTKVAWDAARGAAGHERSPRAESIRNRLGLPWARVLELAAADPSVWPHRLGVRGTERFAEAGADREAMLRALRSVAFQTGSRPGVASYEALRARFNARRQRAGGLAMLMPSGQTITRTFGSWDAAITAAGLDSQYPPTPPRVSSRPPAEVLDEFIEAQGFLPTRGYFEAWCAACDHQVGRAVRRWCDLVDEVRRQRGARGAPTPTVALSRAKSPALPAARERVTRPTSEHSREAILESLRVFGREHLRAGERPTTAKYLQAARVDARLIARSVVMRRGGFQQLCQEAVIA